MLKVILVDDEPFILQGLSVIIDWKAQGFEIAGTANNAIDAIELIQKIEPDLVITDIKMPEMSGLEMLEIVRNEGLTDICFVILSGFNNFEYAKMAMQNDSLDYLLKPIDRDELIAILNRVKKIKNCSAKT